MMNGRSPCPCALATVTDLDASNVSVIAEAVNRSLARRFALLWR